MKFENTSTFNDLCQCLRNVLLFMRKPDNMVYSIFLLLRNGKLSLNGQLDAWYQFLRSYCRLTIQERPFKHCSDTIL